LPLRWPQFPAKISQSVEETVQKEVFPPSVRAHAIIQNSTKGPLIIRFAKTSHDPPTVKESAA